MIVGYIGLGKLGMPCAEKIAEKGYKVKGYDVEKKESELVDVKGDIEECVKDCDVVFVAVPTPHSEEYDGSSPTSELEPKDFDYSIVQDVVKQANRHMEQGQILVLNSTVLPGTVREKIAPLVTSPSFVYNPHFIAMGSVAWDMVNPEMVLVGTQDGVLTKEAENIMQFYTSILESESQVVLGTWEECECIKVFYNTFISAKIGLVNMMQDVAEKQGNIDVDVVADALKNSSKRITSSQYMTPGMGDSGGCHPRDNIALRYLSENLDLGYDLFSAIMDSREKQAENLAKKLVEVAQENDIDPQDICIHGKAYKPGVPYTDGSYSLLVGHYLEKMGYQPSYVDPYTGDDSKPEGRWVFLMAHSASITYGYTDNDVKDELYCPIPPGSVVVDPWRKFESSVSKVIHYGNTRN